MIKQHNEEERKKLMTGFGWQCSYHENIWMQSTCGLNIAKCCRCAM